MEKLPLIELSKLFKDFYSSTKEFQILQNVPSTYIVVMTSLLKHWKRNGLDPCLYSLLFLLAIKYSNTFALPSIWR